MTDYQFVDLKEDDHLATLVAGEARIGVDTEFVRESTFRAELCLVQIAAGSMIYCADPMGLDPMQDDRAATLWGMLTKPDWVLHSARQDLEVIYQTAGLLPTGVFDTQVAAAMLGYQPQLGYARLVSELFDVELAKSHTRADWAERPLPRKVIEYAAEDVQFLLPACDILTERLDELGRLPWAIEDSMDLLDVTLYESRPSEAIDRLKGARNLRGPARKAAARLAEWREQEALDRNRPRQWIMRDAVLLDIAVKRPDSRHKLGQTPGLAARTVARLGDTLIRVITDAGNDQSDYTPPAMPSEAQKAALKRMQKQVANVAKELQLATELIAPKKELSAAMLGQRDLRIFRGWRLELVGKRLLEILDDG